MRVLFLITKTDHGGAQRYVLDMVRALIADGCEVAVMAKSGGWLEDELNNIGVSFFANDLFVNNYNIFKYIPMSKKIWAAVQEFKPDLISCQSGVAGFWGRICIRNRIPTVFTAHGWSFGEGVSYLRHVITRIAETFAAQFCKKIICVSEHDRVMAESYHIVPASKLVTVHNGICIDGAQAPEKVWNHGTLNVVFLGRLAEPKQPEVLLAAYQELPLIEQKSIRITVLGDGPKKKILTTMVQQVQYKDRIALPGSVSQSRVEEVLKKSHIVVLISKHEGFPYAVLEAMRHKCLVIASHVGGIPEVVDHQTTGYLLEGDMVGQKKQLVQLLQYLRTDTDTVRTIASQAQKKFLENFTFEKQYAKTKKIYEEVANSIDR